MDLGVGGSGHGKSGSVQGLTTQELLDEYKNHPERLSPAQREQAQRLSGGSGAATTGGTVGAPVLNPTAYTTPTQQFFGGNYATTDDGQRRSAALDALGSQYADINAQYDALYANYRNSQGRTPDQQKALLAQLQALDTKRKSIHDQIVSGNAMLNDQRARYESNRDIQYLGEQAQNQNQAAPVADFYGGRAPQDLANAEQSRGLQLTAAGNLMSPDSGAGQAQLIEQLKGDMSGQQPSLAQLQLQQGADTALQNQASMAASGGPANSAFAQRNAALAGATTMQNLSMQQAQLRAQEYAQARQELGTTLNQQRGQFIAGQTAAGGILKDTRGADTQMVGFDYQNALEQAKLEAQQRGLNDEQARFYVNAYMAAQLQKQQAQQRYTEQSAANALQAQGIAAGITNANTAASVGHEANANTANAQSWAKLKDVVGTGANALGALKAGDQTTGTTGGGGSGSYGGGSNYGGSNSMYGGSSSGSGSNSIDSNGGTSDTSEFDEKTDTSEFG